MTELAKQYGRYGYPRVTALLHQEGWKVNYKQVERLRAPRGPESAPEASKEVTIVFWRRLLCSVQAAA